jgi:hypothetical protein
MGICEGQNSKEIFFPMLQNFYEERNIPSFFLSGDSV